MAEIRLFPSIFITEIIHYIFRNSLIVGVIMQREPVRHRCASKSWKNCMNKSLDNSGIFFFKDRHCHSPDLKPVIPEPEVVLRFPEVDKLAPPILQLSEVKSALPHPLRI